MDEHKISKHDFYVKQLALALEDKYDSIEQHVELKRKKCSLAEIDLVAKKGNEVHIYEVKCSYRIIKARRQLSRIRRLLKARVTQLYFYHGEGENLVKVDPIEDKW